MYQAKRASVFIFLALGLAPGLAAQTSPPPACPPGANCVLYTSKLLGYIRTDDQRYTPSFEEEMRKATGSYPSALVVAMGDNLAPEFEARFEADRKTPKARTGLKGPLPDNVLDELDKFYDVIVPGKEEFYFGAERLRVLALTSKKLNAANLSATPTYTAPKPDPNEPKPRAYLDSHPHFKTFDDGHLVLERMADRKPAYSIEVHKDEVEIHKDGRIDYAPPELQICDADHPGVDDCRSHLAIKGQVADDGSPNFKVVTYDLSAMQHAHPSGSRRLMCFTKSQEVKSGEALLQHQRFCHAVVIDGNLFQEFPYSVVTKANKKFVVFAVVGADVKQLVSKTNLQWVGGQDNKIKAEVAMWKPASAVRQAYYECRFRNHCDKDTVVVVLAQMSKAAARTLAESIAALKPEIIISKAEAEASPYGDNLDYFASGQKTPVIATHSIFTQDDSCAVPGSPRGQTLRNPLHLVASYTVTVKPKNYPERVEKRLNHAKSPGGEDWCQDRTQTPSPSEIKALREAQAEALGQPVVPGPAPAGFSLDDLVKHSKWPSEDLEHFVAEQMRRVYPGDVGVVSTHEIFREQESSKPIPLGGRTERAIWEGAHVTRLGIAGKNLRQALDAQKDAPADRQLVYSGVVGNDSDNYYVNGKPLQDDSYYTVIAPDALVLGDPSYAAFADNTFQEPEVLDDSVAGFVCNLLSVTDQDRQSCTKGKVDVAPATLGVWSPPPDFHPEAYLASVIAPSYHDPITHLADLCKTGEPCSQATEKSVQLRPVWFAKLLRNDLSYALMKPNTADSTLPTKFAGVTDPRVVQAHAENYSVDHDLRLGRNWSFAAAGVEETIQFGRTRQGSTQQGRGDNVNLTANRGTVGPFFELAFAHNAAPNWRLIVRPANFADNFARTPTSFSGAAGTSFNLSLPAQRTLATAAGLRYEAPQRKDSLFGKDGNTYFEAGYKSTFNINLPTVIALNPGPTQTPCSLAVATFAQCAASVVAVSPNAAIIAFENNRQQGVYWTGMFSFPIGKRFTYKVASAGDFRFGDISSAETLYAVTMDNYLQTRIWGNLSLAPHMGWFLYENQVEHNTLTRRTYDVSLSYSFDWHRGMGWRSFFMQRETAK